MFGRLGLSPCPFGHRDSKPVGAGLDWEGSNIGSGCLGSQKLAQLCSGKAPAPGDKLGGACREFTSLPPLTLHLNWGNWEQGLALGGDPGSAQ